MASNQNDIYTTPRTGATQTETGVLHSARQAASGLMDQVKDQATNQAQEKKQTLAAGLHSVADAIRQMSEGLSRQESGPVAQYAAQVGRSLGDRTDGLSRYMEGRHVREMADDLHNFARRKPAVFLGSALVLGLAASRFLKSSRPTQRIGFDGGNYGRQPTGTPTGSSTASSQYGETSASSFDNRVVQDWARSQSVVGQQETTGSISSRPVQPGSSGSGQGTDDKVEL